MKALLTTVLLMIFASLGGYAQITHFGFGYDYLSSPQLDQLIRTYNLSRPFINEKQPFLTHGLNFEAAYIQPSDKNFRPGVTANFSSYRSKAGNSGSDIRFTYNTLNIGFLLHCFKPSSLKGLYVDVAASGIVGVLSKRLNQAPFLVDGTRLRSFQFGGLLGLHLGYKLALGDGLDVSPVVGLQFAPYLSEGKSEAVINQTSTLVEGETKLLNLQFGFRIHL